MLRVGERASSSTGPLAGTEHDPTSTWDACGRRDGWSPNALTANRKSGSLAQRIWDDTRDEARAHPRRTLERFDAEILRDRADDAEANRVADL